MTDTLIAPTPVVSDPETEEEEPRVAHIVRREDQMRGYIDGVPIKALCGKIWVPTRNPEDLPVCPRCKDLLAQLNSARQGNN